MTAAELTIDDFCRFRDNWKLATPEEKHDMVKSMLEAIYVDFASGHTLEVMAKPGLRWVLEAVELTISPDSLPGDSSVVIGDPEGIRSFHAQRNFVTRLAESVPLVWNTQSLGQDQRPKREDRLSRGS